jgi:Flp pilus assembly protein TadG
MTAHRRRDRGSVTVEMVLLTPVLMLFAIFAIFGGRTAESMTDVQHAADQGARAASLVSSSRMRAEAVRAVRLDLDQRGVSCPDPAISVEPSLEGRVVTVTVTCRAREDGLEILSVDTPTLTASSTEVVDRYRAGD